MSLVPEMFLEADDSVERKISHTLEDVRRLMRDIQTGDIDSLAAAKSALEISTTADGMHQALKYLDERLKLIHGLLSEIENALAETGGSKTSEPEKGKLT